MSSDPLTIKQPNGDTYIGFLVMRTAYEITLDNYAVWYEGCDAPFSCPNLDEQVVVRLTPESLVY